MWRSESLQLLNFFNVDMMVQIGFPIRGHMRGNLVHLEGQVIDVDTLQAVFRANMGMFDGLAAPMDDATAWLLEALPACNRFAGEWSADPDRDRKIANALEETGCALADAAYDAALGSDAVAPEVMCFLEVRAPVWR